MADIWFKCDTCGQFITFADIFDGSAERYMKYPDSHFTVETFVTNCKRHTRKALETDNGS